VMFQEYFAELVGLQSYRWDHRREAEPIWGVTRLGEYQLVGMRGGSLSIAPRELPAPPSRPLRLAQTTRAAVVRVGGPNRSTRFALKRARRAHLHFAALCAILRIALGSTAASIAAIETRAAEFAPPLDVLEVKGAGLNTLCDAIAVVLVERLAAISPSHAYKRRVGSSGERALYELITCTAEYVCEWMRSRHLADDDLVVRYNAGPEPRYGSGVGLVSQVRAELSTRVQRISTRANSIYYLMTDVVFGSDPGDATLDAAIRALRRAAGAALISGRIGDADADFIVGSTLARLSRSSARSEDERLERFVDLCHSYDRYCRGIHPVSSEAQRVALSIVECTQRHRVTATTRSAREVVREFRRKQPPPRRQRDRLSSPPPLGLQLSKSALQPSTAWGRESDTLLQERWWSAAVGDASDLGSSASTLYRAAAEYFPVHSCVLIIGSGLGAAAAALLLRRGGPILGHDLRADMPRTSTAQSYTPPLVRHYNAIARRPRGSGGFAQTEESFTTSGDWFDSQVASDLIARIDMSWTILLDIPGSERCVERLLAPLVHAEFGGIVALRLHTTSNVCALAFGVIHLFARELSVVAFEQEPVLGQCLVFIRLRSAPLKAFARPLEPSTRHVCTPREGRRSVSAILAAIIEPLCIPLSGSVRLVLTTALQQVHALATAGAARPSYNTWTRILEAGIASNFALLPREQQRSLISSMAPGAIYRLNEPHGLTVVLSSRVLARCARLSSRLCESLDIVL
jgi:hypothetical protein